MTETDIFTGRQRQMTEETEMSPLFFTLFSCPSFSFSFSFHFLPYFTNACFSFPPSFSICFLLFFSFPHYHHCFHCHCHFFSFPSFLSFSSSSFLLKSFSARRLRRRLSRMMILRVRSEFKLRRLIKAGLRRIYSGSQRTFADLVSSPLRQNIEGNDIVCIVDDHYC